MRCLLVTALLLVPGEAASQSVSIAASRWLTDPHVTDYRLTVSSYRAGPILLFPFAQLAVQGPRSDGATLAGVGGDVVIRLTGDARVRQAGLSGSGATVFALTANSEDAAALADDMQSRHRDWWVADTLLSGA